MNKERLLKLADAIEKRSIPNLAFNMSTYSNNIDLSNKNIHNKYSDLDIKHSCNTSGCMAGWAFVLKGNTLGQLTSASEISGIDSIHNQAKKWLGLSSDAASHLFASFTNAPDAGLC